VPLKGGAHGHAEVVNRFASFTGNGVYMSFWSSVTLKISQGLREGDNQGRSVHYHSPLSPVVTRIPIPDPVSNEASLIKYTV
jgi:hypothetical protein